MHHKVGRVQHLRVQKFTVHEKQGIGLVLRVNAHAGAKKCGGKKYSKKVRHCTKDNHLGNGVQVARFLNVTVTTGPRACPRMKAGFPKEKRGAQRRKEKEKNPLSGLASFA
jgi:hypothetical protein